jgi:hypothetical protein
LQLGGQMQVLLGDPEQLGVSQQFRNRLAVEDLRATLWLSEASVCSLCLVTTGGRPGLLDGCGRSQGMIRSVNST